MGEIGARSKSRHGGWSASAHETAMPRTLCVPKRLRQRASWFAPRRGAGAANDTTHRDTTRCARIRRCPPAVIIVMSTSCADVDPCAACGASTPLVCASCLKTRFCSPACAAAAWAAHRAACADFSVLAALPDDAPAPVPPAAPLVSMAPAAGAGAGDGARKFSGSGFACAVCGSSNAAVCARCRLVGYCSREHQSKDWTAHKAVCRPGEFGMVPVLSWEQRVLAEAAAAAPASRAATAALPPVPFWDVLHEGSPPTTVLRAWRKAAEGGHADAQNYLGVCCSFGMGVAKDTKAAAVWYAKAAAQGHADAQFNLGVGYNNGSGVAQDAKAAFEWYAMAAAQGSAAAQCALGIAYADGTGVAQDARAAFEWFIAAAVQGNADALFNLGACYANGTAVAQDFRAAAAWFAKAAAAGHADAPARRDDCAARAAFASLARGAVAASARR
jgi:hypothetical protein